MDTDENLKDPQTHQIIGAAMTVHRELGQGFLEAVYQEAFAFELTSRSIFFQREVILPVLYRGETLKCGYRADFVCFSEIIVEIKAIDRLSSTETAQTLNYLKAAELRRGLLLNFGSPRLEYKRLVSHLRSSATSVDI